MTGKEKQLLKKLKDLVRKKGESLQKLTNGKNR